jgi:diguanylate cyclase (GGDEF)-like protein
MPSPSSTQVAHGLEAIIDAAAGVLAEESLTATLQGMARALDGVVPFTSLAIYEADHRARLLVPVFAVGRDVADILAARPPLDAGIAGTPVEDPGAGVVVPLIVADRVIGTLDVWREKADFTPHDAQLIRRFATLAALAYANAQQRERLLDQALTDELTGLANRRQFHDRLIAELARTRRDGRPLSVILFDLDDFRSVNDEHGHPAGDDVLRGFAELLRDEARVSDIVCRIGGEEFAVLLPNTTTAESVRYAVRVLLACRTARLRPGGGRLTASAGAASAPADALDGETLLRVADRRLLDAKAGGKDRVDVGLVPIA